MILSDTLMAVTAGGSESVQARTRCKARSSGSRALIRGFHWLWLKRFGKYSRKWAPANLQKSRSLFHLGHCERIARVRIAPSDITSGRAYWELPGGALGTNR